MAMGASSAAACRLGCTSAPTVSWKGSRVSARNLVSMGLTRRGLVSLRSPRFRVFCAAKPETVSKVMQVVKKQLALPDDTALTPESKFTDIGADSLDTVEIVMSLEEEFEITVEEDNSQNIITIQDAADLIEKLVGDKAA